ncbi:MAG: hypothetical protein J6X18_06535 [Bacteroidales bacterium]|nr:hypothetical protein [Bacteroidales bacterium]
MLNVKKQEKGVRVVYDISLDGTAIVAGISGVAGGADKHPVISNTDG